MPHHCLSSLDCAVERHTVHRLCPVIHLLPFSIRHRNLVIYKLFNNLHCYLTCSTIAVDAFNDTSYIQFLDLYLTVFVYLFANEVLLGY